MAFQNFKLDTDADGIALVTWDAPGRSMNVIDPKVIEELRRSSSRSRATPRSRARSSPRARTRSAPAPISPCWKRSSRTFAEMVKAQGEEAANAKLFEESRKLSQLYRRIETCGKPWVAAINGTALGGGFELDARLPPAHRRRQRARRGVGLPEIKIGLFPGAGGTQRIARMMPPADALQFLLKGEQLRLDRAKAMKLIDAVVPAADLIKTAKDWIKAGGKAIAPWDEPKVSGCPAGSVYSKAGMMVFPPANAIYRRETYDNYPAAKRDPAGASTRACSFRWTSRCAWSRAGSRKSCARRKPPR